MNQANLLRLVLLVSCAHAMVHVYELSLPSVEQLIAADFGVGRATSGNLATAFRLPFGLFAIVVGWLVDRYGAKIMLTTYLLGCAAAAGAAAIAPSLPVLFVVMFAMGSFASMYHPAGLALLSHETSIANRTRALGAHGIFGSAGIGSAPFLAWAVFATGATWRQYYALLIVPGAVLGLWFLLRVTTHNHARDPASAATSASDEARWRSFFVITLFGTMSGFIYAAFLTFLPRYLDEAGVRLISDRPEATRNFLTGCVLTLGMIGQYTAGRIARPGKLEPLLMLIMLANAPFLLAMALASGLGRVWVTAGFALVHFMNQPIYNSLIASYAPRRRRSLCYGFSFLMTFGLGSFGATFAGHAGQWYTERTYYATLAMLAVLASSVSALLWYWNRHRTE
ncbi:MAG: MFS transporter [Pirellulales bacterium]